MSTEQFEIYKCEICSNTVEVLFPGVGTLVCCNQEMTLLPEKTEELAFEKHVPIVECKNDDYTEVKVGATPHPMVEEHYIQMIEAIDEDNKVLHRKYFNPHQEAKFEIKNGCAKIKAREICNIHGLWRSKKND